MTDYVTARRRSCSLAQVKDDSTLQECRPAGGDAVPWEVQHRVVANIYVDGLGHALGTYLGELHIALMYGCRCTLPIHR
jgi:hypothetical protein